MLNEISPLPLEAFFHIKVSVGQKDRLKKRKRIAPFLPNPSFLFSEDSFAFLAISWGLDGLRFDLKVDKPLEEVVYPKYREGDSLELFIDTRNLKQALSVHRFCHHFIFLPEEVKGEKGYEVTLFRFDEKRKLVSSDLFAIQTTIKKKTYEMEIDIPKEALHGYAPNEFNHLGFTYRINRYGGKAQSFALSSQFFAIEKHPSLWATLVLENS